MDKLTCDTAAAWFEAEVKEAAERLNKATDGMLIGTCKVFATDGYTRMCEESVEPEDLPCG